MSIPKFTLRLLKIPVSNITRSVEFYRDMLGCHEEFIVEEYGWAQLIIGDLPLALYQPGMGGGNAEPGGSTGFHLSLAASAFDPLATSLQDAGVLVENMVHQGNDGSVFIDVQDPDVNILKIMRNKDDVE